MDPNDNYGQNSKPCEIAILTTTLCLLNDYYDTYLDKSLRHLLVKNEFVSCCMEIPVDSIT